MRVLVIGLGDIARKAYLPVLTRNPELEIHVTTRDPSVLDAVGAEHRIAGRYSSLDEALSSTSFDAAFVHAATAAHPSLVNALLDRGIPVLVDKPLAYTLDEASRLIDLAVTNKTLLSVGFNRRHAPDYAALVELPRSFILLQKHRQGKPDAARRFIFDDFIHVVDTLRFLAPKPIERLNIETVVHDGMLEGVTLTMAGEAFNAVGAMYRTSGLDEERLDVVGGDWKRSIVNLSERIDFDGSENVRRRGDWTSVGLQRGFEAMCADFLAGVRIGRATAAQDLHETHRICELIVAHTEECSN